MKFTILAIILLVALYFASPAYSFFGPTENSNFALRQAKGIYMVGNGEQTPMSDVYLLHLGQMGGFYFILSPERVAMVSLISLLAIGSLFYFSRPSRLPESTPV
jgi:hypothetical protein